jgi:hypothetical protein
MTSHPVRVRTSDGWQDLALQGEPGPEGPTGPGVPVGGAVGQVLTKVSTTDFDAGWQTPPGGAGGDDAAYVHTQSTATAVWTVAHNLGKYPSVTVTDSAGSTILPDIHYDSTAQVTLTFGSPTSGLVFCN